VSRAALGVGFAMLLVVLTGCSDEVRGTGTLASEALVVAGAATSPPATASPAPKPAPVPAPAPRKRDPATVAAVVDVRTTDLPGGWDLIPGSRRDNDTFNWVIGCARDAGVGPGPLSGAETPDFSSSATASTSQVGSATGVFADDAAAKKFVALYRSPTFGACVASEAVRRWATIRGEVPAFRPSVLRVAGAAEAAGMGSTVTFRTGQRATVQFFAVRTGPVVTALNTLWFGAPASALVNGVAARLAARQRTV
jgi:hypothetical protein